MELTQSILEKVFCHIDGDEIAQLALDLGRIRGPSGHEEEVGEYVYTWMKENGLNPIKQFVAGKRFNVIGKLPGMGKGEGVVFNSHLDTCPRFEGEAQAGVENEAVHTSWAEGDRLYGLGVLNCRGPMAIWLVMAKALKKSGLKLGGDILLAAVVGEIGLSPIDEYQGPRYMGRGIGTAHSVRYGHVVDYAIVCETTDFGVCWAECGYVCLRIRTKGVLVLSARLENYKNINEHPNAVTKMLRVVEIIENWAREYEAKSIYESSEGVFTPKVNIGAIRGGFPPMANETASSCSIFMSIGLLPGEGPTRVMREIKEAIATTGIEADVSSYLFKKGYIGKNVEPIVSAVQESYQQLCNAPLPKVTSAISSMQRDINIYNEFGVPAITFGPTRHIDERVPSKDVSIKYESAQVKYFLKDEMVKAAKLYAMAALRLCSVIT